MQAGSLAGLLVLLPILLAPAATAQSPGAVVDIVAVDVPVRTAAGHAFNINVTLHNRGSQTEEITIFAALYAGPDRPGECGAATDPAFRRATTLAQPALTLAPGERLTYPPPGGSWLQRYESGDVPARDAMSELCVFAIDRKAGQRVTYRDWESTTLLTRGVNAKPVADFSFDPSAPSAAAPTRFHATATDAEGDELTFHWDFGHDAAAGRAVGSGPSPTHAFYPEGEFHVTLVVSDGFDETRVVKRIVVATELPPAAETKSRFAPTPIPWTVTLAALLLPALLRRGR